MRRRFLDDFEAVLLDTVETFMFDADRFGDVQPFHDTYRPMGGRTLRPTLLHRCIGSVFDAMREAGRDPTRDDDFGDLHGVLLGTKVGRTPDAAEARRVVHRRLDEETAEIKRTFAQPSVRGRMRRIRGALPP